MIQHQNTLRDALEAKYPHFKDQISQIFEKEAFSGGSLIGPQASLLDSKVQIADQKEELVSFPHFGQLTGKIQKLLGIEQFRIFVDHYVNKIPEHSQVIKEELNRLEKEAFTLETKEQEKFTGLGLSAPTFESRNIPHSLICHSSIADNIEDEFKEAKWVVLTSPIIQQKITTKSGHQPLQRESSMNLGTSAGTGNFTIQLNNLASGSSRLNSGSSASNMALQAAAQAKQLIQAPQKRYGHTACLVKNKMYIFGGLASQQKGGNLQTFFECQLRFAAGGSEIGLNSSNSQLLFQWDKIKGDAPRARDSHTIIHVGDALIMFGGSGGTNSFNDLYKFDLRHQKWHKLEPNGDLPAPREGHIAKLIGKDKMLVHGGVDQNETSFSDTYILDGISQFIDNSQLSSIFTAYIPNYDMNLNKSFSTPVSSNFQGDGGVQSVDGVFPTTINNDPNALQSSLFNLDSDTVNTMAPQSGDGGLASIQKMQSYDVNKISSKGPKKLRWHKCIETGSVPQGRDSHSGVLINNKIYIFGGQGDGDIIFDDLHSCEIQEEIDPKTGEALYVANWTVIEPQTPAGSRRPLNKPRARTSHSCTVYKNRYMIIVGGEGQLDESEIRALQLANASSGSKKETKKSKKSAKSKNDSELCVDIDPDEESESIDAEGIKKAKNGESIENEEDEEDKVDDYKRTLNDVWVYDTLMQKWHEISPPLRIQGSLLGKKIKKEFEPRMAHSAVSLNQFVILFGGLSNDNQLVSNDLYVLSLDGNLGAISQAFEGISFENEPKPAPISIQIPLQQKTQQQASTATISQSDNFICIPMTDTTALQRSSSLNPPTITNGNQQLQQSKSSKASKTLKLTNPEDRKVMSGQILNQIINYNNGLTHQIFINGGPFSHPLTVPTTSMTSTYPGGTNSLDQTYAGQTMSLSTFQGPKSHTETQTLLDLPNQESSIDQLQNDSRKQALMILQKQNDYRLQSFQRTRFQFVKSLADQLTWPIQCFGGLLDNSIEAFDIARSKIEQAKLQQNSAGQQFTFQNSKYAAQNLDIEINMKQPSQNEDAKGYPIFSSSTYIEFKDNGTGMHPKQLMEALTSIGQSSKNQNKSDFSFSEHGIGLKLNSLRLAQSTLIITKTRPVSEFGTTSHFLSFGLISSEFMKKADSINGFLSAPIVSYEIKNKKISKPLTPEPEHFLTMISNFTKAKFISGEALLQYGLQSFGDLGGTHIFFFNLGKQKLEKQGPDYPELLFDETTGDIKISPLLFPVTDLPQNLLIETSLSDFLRFLYIEYPTWLRVSINGNPVNLQNPYSHLKTLYSQAFFGSKSEKFAVQCLNEEVLSQILNVTKEEPQESLIYDEAKGKTSESIARLQGVLVYRGNRLIRRLECIIGEDDDMMLMQSMNKNVQGQFGFKQNAIVSVFKSRSQTTLDKKDFSEKQIIRKVKDWFRLRENTTHQNN